MTNALAPLSGARRSVDSDRSRTKFKPRMRPSRASSRQPSPLFADVEAMAAGGALDDAADAVLVGFFLFLFLELLLIGNVQSPELTR
jgi:hypothetical protein